ncbi:MAG TPA: universal stress protein [Xanthobacteraceae bacterium]|nr:universal stress protein [Xanthobacteraceae bacterium]
MSMRSILVPIEQHDLMTSTLETVLLVARRFGSYVEGFAMRPAIDNFVAMDPVSSMAMATVRQNDAEISRQARHLFETFMQAHVPPAEPGTPSLSYGWLDAAPDGDNFVGSYGRVFDITVIGRPGDQPQSPRMITLEAALFESGRPILIAPPTTPTRLGENVLVAWNCSTEQAKTTAFAMPFLHQAKKVTVLTVEGGTVPGPTGAQLARYFERNGIAADAITVAPDKRTTGEVILARAQALGCDLVVKGAYTQSRLRQMIFGGTTRHILTNAMLPVLMAN